MHVGNYVFLLLSVCYHQFTYPSLSKQGKDFSRQPIPAKVCNNRRRNKATNERWREYPSGAILNIYLDSHQYLVGTESNNLQKPATANAQSRKNYSKTYAKVSSHARNILLWMFNVKAIFRITIKKKIY